MKSARSSTPFIDEVGPFASPSSSKRSLPVDGLSCRWCSKPRSVGCDCKKLRRAAPYDTDASLASGSSSSQSTPLHTSSPPRHSTPYLSSPLRPAPSSSSHAANVGVKEEIGAQEHGDADNVLGEETVQPKPKRFGLRGGTKRAYYAAKWDRAVPPRAGETWADANTDWAWNKNA